VLDVRRAASLQAVVERRPRHAGQPAGRGKVALDTSAPGRELVVDDDMIESLYDFPAVDIPAAAVRSTNPDGPVDRAGP
jgi:hypothetical protein